MAVESQRNFLICEDRSLIDNLVADEAGEELANFLGTIPKRWGRMNRLSRLLLVKTALLLADAGYCAGEKLSAKGLSVGLIGVSCYGSLQTDYDFLATMDGGAAFASPALFGYTLANIPLAEVAVAFGLRGPVFALIGEGEKENLLACAKEEAQHYLDSVPELHFMLACAFDCYQQAQKRVEYVLLDLVKR